MSTSSNICFRGVSETSIPKRPLSFTTYSVAAPSSITCFFFSPLPERGVTPLVGTGFESARTGSFASPAGSGTASARLISSTSDF